MSRLSKSPRPLGLKRASLKAMRGASLIIVLVILAAMLVLTVVVSQSNVFLERASSNSREVDVAFQAAETALRAGELAAAGLAGPSDGDANCANGICYLADNGYRLSLGQWAGLSVTQAARETAPPGASASQQAAWVSLLDAGGPAVTLPAGTVPSAIRQPSYVIEILPSARAGEDGSSIIYVYRITAKGYGRGANSAVVVQSVYSPPGT